MAAALQRPMGLLLLSWGLALPLSAASPSTRVTYAPLPTPHPHPSSGAAEPGGGGGGGDPSAAMYSWNNNNSNPDCSGGIIIEGCAQYPRGPTCWGSPPNATDKTGSYGWIALGPKANHSADCPAIPASGIGSALGADTPLFPVSLKEALTQDGLPICVLACNISEVQRTGVDPCNKGTIAANSPLPAWLLPPVQKTGSPEQFPGPVTMSCFWGGKVRSHRCSPRSRCGTSPSRNAVIVSCCSSHHLQLGQIRRDLTPPNCPLVVVRAG